MSIGLKTQFYIQIINQLSNEFFILLKLKSDSICYFIQRCNFLTNVVPFKTEQFKSLLF